MTMRRDSPSLRPAPRSSAPSDREAARRHRRGSRRELGAPLHVLDPLHRHRRPSSFRSPTQISPPSALSIATDFAGDLLGVLGSVRRLELQVEVSRFRSGIPLSRRALPGRPRDRVGSAGATSPRPLRLPPRRPRVDQDPPVPLPSLWPPDADAPSCPPGAPPASSPRPQPARPDLPGRNRSPDLPCAGIGQPSLAARAPPPGGGGTPPPRRPWPGRSGPAPGRARSAMTSPGSAA